MSDETQGGEVKRYFCGPNGMEEVAHWHRGETQFWVDAAALAARDAEVERLQQECETQHGRTADQFDRAEAAEDELNEFRCAAHAASNPECAGCLEEQLALADRLAEAVRNLKTVALESPDPGIDGTWVRHEDLLGVLAAYEAGEPVVHPDTERLGAAKEENNG